MSTLSIIMGILFFIILFGGSVFGIIKLSNKGNKIKKRNKDSGD